MLESGDAERLALTAGHVPEVDASSAAVVVSQDPTRREITVAEPGKTPHELGEVDVVFPLLHGPWGEDGTIQGLFEVAGIRYVGSGVLASAVGMDKHYMKVVLAGAGLPVIAVRRDQAARVGARPRRRARGGQGARLPGVREAGARWVEPRHHARCTSEDELDAAVEHAREFDPKVLVEPSAEGAREVECGVLERLEGGADASAVAEITGYGEHEFYDFAAKYLGEEGVTLEVPADLPRRGHRADPAAVGARPSRRSDCEGLARVDFFVQHDGSIAINEINTMPGFTPASMYPRMWAESGVDYPELVDRLLALALRRSTGLR